VQIVWIGSLFFALLIALFAVQNTAPVTVSFLAWRIEALATSMLVLGAAALGALTTYLFGLSREIRGRLERRGSRSTIRGQDSLIEELRTRVRELEQENEGLRAGAGVGSQEPGVGGAGQPETPAAGASSAAAALVDFPPSEPQLVPAPPAPTPPDARPGDRSPQPPASNPQPPP
jgi:uncharacterized integral membrane protein